MNKKTQLNSVDLKQIDSRKCERTLGAHMGPSMQWVLQFSAMKEKMLDAINKLKSTVVCTSAASVHHNMCLKTKVYFGTGVMKLMPK